MSGTFTDRDAAGIGALSDPLRRRLYLFVCAQPDPVSRELAADRLGLAPHQVKFHLDRLERDGLLDAIYARVSGRSGPGAGRPAKLYRRTDREIAVSLPERQYQLAGRLMADAIAESTDAGTPVIEVLHRLAHSHGRRLGDAAVGDQLPRTVTAALDLAVRTLAENGYEPRRQDARVVMANCPFHTLARAQTELVCKMNHALIDGLAGALGPHGPIPELDPAPDRCCVVLTAARKG
ncbi:transcriptional regulator [Mycobacterium sp. ACS1612]|uniref:helix-turn-helix transcriptional regulator n=1 Tax=Mycobacterium sp. ACS1612 TaxID=1834117 RepID=UPI0007FF53B0|nr:helix-turn-helix domain-containing protein [Mycobacterium sp. ACS1612]OBF39238.1 transcriptional regulator [Mycobacterium sp. ACS1612]